MADKLTVLILAAGYGRRMGPFSRMINKGLVPYQDRALISHIIERFPADTTRFVIACGHLAQQVQDYVSNVHADKDITFVNITDYAEDHTGPATTIRQCREHLPGAFLWLACDTVFDFDYKDKLDHNWIGVYPVDQAISADYCWVRRDGDHIREVHNKVPGTSAVDAFIGLMYARDSQYLDNLDRVGALETYEGFVQDLPVRAHTVYQWLDFGTYEKWQEITAQDPEHSFVKPNEIFYHDNGSVIKYFSDETNVSRRVVRAQANPGCMPKNLRAAGHFLIHDWVDGDILYNQITPDLFKRMLDWCERSVWHRPEQVDLAACQAKAKQFYHDKTLERANQFRVKYADWSECLTINSQTVESIDYYLERLDWHMLTTLTDWRFIHGDLHFDNVIYDPDSERFTCIDWRTDFAGDVLGDLYYDLAKMLGGIRLSYLGVKQGDLHYQEQAGTATIQIPSVDQAEVYESILEQWARAQGLHWPKVQALVPLIYLNMSPLHEEPFDKALIALSQLYFSRL